MHDPNHSMGNKPSDPPPQPPLFPNFQHPIELDDNMVQTSLALTSVVVPALARNATGSILYGSERRGKSAATTHLPIEFC